MTNTTEDIQEATQPHIMGLAQRKSIFEHAQTVQIHIILRIRKVWT